MNKKEYFEKMEDILRNVDEQVKRDILADFEVHFVEGLANGRTEEEISDELGDPESLREELLSLCKDSVKEEKANDDGEFSYEENIGKNSKVAKVVADMISADICLMLSEDDLFHMSYEADGTVSYKMSQPITCNQMGDTYVIKQNEKQGRFFGFRATHVEYGSSRLELRIPKDFKDAKIKTLSGDVDVEEVSLSENLSVESKSGDVEIEDVVVNNRLRVFTISGDIDVSNTSCVDFNAESTAGDVTVGVDEKTEKGRLKTVSGDITIDGIHKGEYNIDTVSGDVDISFSRACKGARINGSTISGDISCDYDRRISGGYGNRKFETIFGDLSTVMNIKTVSGDIEIQ